MFRWSMLIGWASLLRNPRRARAASAGSVGDFVLIQPSGEKGAGYRHTGVLPSTEKEKEIAPEAGDVATRHETTNLFEDSDAEDEKGGLQRRGSLEREDVV